MQEREKEHPQPQGLDVLGLRGQQSSQCYRHVYQAVGPVQPGARLLGRQLPRREQWSAPCHLRLGTPSASDISHDLYDALSCTGLANGLAARLASHMAAGERAQACVERSLTTKSLVPMDSVDSTSLSCSALPCKGDALSEMRGERSEKGLVLSWPRALGDPELARPGP